MKKVIIIGCGMAGIGITPVEMSGYLRCLEKIPRGVMQNRVGFILIIVFTHFQNGVFKMFSSLENKLVKKGKKCLIYSKDVFTNIHFNKSVGLPEEVCDRMYLRVQSTAFH